jgi:protein-tyrosine phosphatase
LIDVHCHILPGIDDGPEDMQAALNMGRIAVQDGVRTIIATPHCYDGVYDCQAHDIIALTDAFNAALWREKIGLTVLPGAEIRLTPELVDCFGQGRLLTLGNGWRAVLLELPEMFIPAAVIRVIKKLLSKDVRCILAHPERNSSILAKNDILDDLVYAGAELQFTGESLTGGFGRESRLLVQKFMTMDVRCYLASDGHDARKRKPVLAKAVKHAARLVGREAAAEMVTIELGNAQKRTDKANGK